MEDAPQFPNPLGLLWEGSRVAGPWWEWGGGCWGRYIVVSCEVVVNVLDSEVSLELAWLINTA